MKMIIGLGNPGQKYANTRHNIGFMVADEIARRIGSSVDKKKFRSLIGEGNYRGERILLLKPQTYMNLSGTAVVEALNFYADRVDDLLVIHDDLDLPLGRIRFKNGGGSGGHNGLKSIQSALNSQDYARLKLGIGRPADERMEVSDYVLGSFAAADREDLARCIDIAAEGALFWLLEGIERAMNDYNQKN